MFNSNKKMMNRNTAWLLQYVVDVILEGLTCIMLEHLLEVKHDALTERGPSLGWSFGMSEPINVFPRSVSHLCLYDLLPLLPGFIGVELSIQLELFCSFHDGDGKLCSFDGLHSLLVIHLCGS